MPRPTWPELGVVAGVLLGSLLLFFFPVFDGETFSDVFDRQRQTYPWAGVAEAANTIFDVDGTPIAGDWNCDGVDEVGVWKAGRVRLPSSRNGPPVSYRLGRAADKPVAGDWNGDGCDEVALYRNGSFLIPSSRVPRTPAISFEFGAASDAPLAGDWDSDGADEMGVRSGDRFNLRDSFSEGPADKSIVFGSPTNVPVVGDWDGDGTTDVGVQIENAFHLRTSLSAGPADIFRREGLDGDRPIPGDWNGDGRDTFALKRGDRVILPADDAELLHFDQADSFFPWQVFINDALRSGELPLWNPYSFAGVPFLSNGQNAVLYPPRFALSLLLSPARVHDVLVISHLLLAGIAMLALLLHAGTRVAGALVGAVAWMFNSFMLAWLALDHVAAIALWLPVAFLLVDLAVRRRSWIAAAGLGVVLALMYLGGNALFVEASFVAVFAYGCVPLAQRLWASVRGGRLSSARRSLGGDALRLTAPWLIAAGLGAVALIPNLELASVSGRDPLPYGELVDFRLQADDLWNYLRVPTELDPYHTNLFLGTPVALLAVVGVFRRGRPLASYSRWLAAVVLLYALGTPVTRLAYEVLPGFDNFKPLSRALFLFSFAVAVLAAFGTDMVLGRVERVTALRATWKRAVAPAAVAGILAVSLLQLHDFGDRALQRQPAAGSALYPPTPLIERLTREDNVRILPIQPAFPGSTTMVFGLQSGSGYESLLPRRTTNLWRVVEGVDVDRVDAVPFTMAYHATFSATETRLDLLARVGITHLVTPQKLTPGLQQRLRRLGFRRVYSGIDGRLYAVPQSVGSAYVVAACAEATSPQEALELFVEPGFAFQRTVVLEREDVRGRPIDCASARARDQAGRAVVLDRGLSSLSIRTDAAEGGILVVPESWDRGWTATVDDEPADVIPANSAFRAVVVPAGRHTVELRYSSPGYESARLVSGATLVLVLAFAGTTFVRRRTTWKGLRSFSTR